MSALYDLLAAILAFFYDLSGGSFGFAIIGLTLTVMVVTTPLTIKGTRSMMAMQRLQPEMKAIQDRYKDDRERLNTELMAFYKENDISPVSGCLPLFLQFPVFLILFQILRGLTRRVSDLGSGAGWYSGVTDAGAELTAIPDEVALRPFDPAFLEPSTPMAVDLHGTTSMDWLGMDLSQSAWTVVRDDPASSLPYLVIIAIVAASGWYQQKQTQARSTAEPNPQQQMMARIMLIFLPFISFSLPAGITVYFVASNLFRVGQQAYINHSLPKDETPAGGKGDKGEKGEKGGKGSKDSAAGGKGGKGSKADSAKGSKKAAGGSSKTKTASRTQQKNARKRYTSDPKAKAAGPRQVQPRARTKKKR